MTPTEQLNFTIAIIGAATGVLGTGLGFWSLARELDREKVKLRVSPTVGIPVLGGIVQPHTLTVEITNLSAFPISIAQVAFPVGGADEVCHWLEVRTYDGGPLQRRLEPRTSMTVVYPNECIRDPAFARVRCVRVTTACGVQKEATSKAFQGLVNSARKLHGLDAGA